MLNKINRVIKLLTTLIGLECSGSTRDDVKLAILKEIKGEINSLISSYTKGE